MYNRRVENEIIEKIKSFEETLIIPCGYAPNFVEKVLEDNPKYAFYIARLQTRNSVNAYVDETQVAIAYQNKEFDLDDVYAVDTAADVMSLLSRYIGNYKTRLGLVTGGNVDIVSAFKEFRDKYTVVYPNFTQVGIKQYSLGSKEICQLEFEYRIGRVKLNMMEVQVQAQVDKIAATLFNPSMPAEVKAYLAHNYLATSIVYYGADVNSNLEKSYVHLTLINI